MHDGLHAPELDRDALRRDSPGCARGFHFNAAGSSLMPRVVVDAMTAHLALEAELGGYEAARAAAGAIRSAYDSVGALLGADADEVAFVDSGSRAFALALHAIPFVPGDRVLVTETEYPGNFVALRHLATRAGVSLEVVPHDADGLLDVDRLAARIDDRVRLISVVHVPTNNGLVNPVEDLARVDRKRALLFVDACQSFGQLPLDLRALGCDVLVATGRKYLRGPRGTALLVTARGALPLLRPIVLDTHSSVPDSVSVVPVDGARRFETWETNVAAKLGVGAAARYLASVGIANAHHAIARSAERLRESLRVLHAVRVLDLGRPRSGLVTFVVDGPSAQSVAESLEASGFSIDLCDLRGSLLAARFPDVDTAIRASVHYYTSDDEVDSFVSRVERIARRCEGEACPTR